VSIDSWRQNFDEPDDRRMVRLGELVEPIVASDGSTALREGLAKVLLARLGATPPSDDRTHEWAASGELLADERAWAAESQADDAEYLRCFQEARAFGAVREVTADVDDGDAVAAAIYELFHSLGASADAVFDVLSQAPDPWAALARDAGRRT
jgi:hypothetical protein